MAFDPYQAELLSQYLQRQGIRTHEVTFQASNLTKMASVLMESFRDRTIDLYNDQELLADFRRLRLVEKTWGLKLESARDETGHADAAISFCVALMVIREIPPLSGLAWGGVIQTRNNIFRPAGTGEQLTSQPILQKGLNMTDSDMLEGIKETEAELATTNPKPHRQVEIILATSAQPICSTRSWGSPKSLTSSRLYRPPRKRCEASSTRWLDPAEFHDRSGRRWAPFEYQTQLLSPKFSDDVAGGRRRRIRRSRRRKIGGSNLPQERRRLAAAAAAERKAETEKLFGKNYRSRKRRGQPWKLIAPTAVCR